jgi:hypothetical protein
MGVHLSYGKGNKPKPPITPCGSPTPCQTRGAKKHGIIASMPLNSQMANLPLTLPHRKNVTAPVIVRAAPR